MDSSAAILYGPVVSVVLMQFCMVLSYLWYSCHAFQGEEGMGLDLNSPEFLARKVEILEKELADAQQRVMELEVCGVGTLMHAHAHTRLQYLWSFDHETRRCTV